MPGVAPKIDWDAMEDDWRAGVKTVLHLSEEYGVSRAAIIKHWDKAGVERDLSAKIRAKAEALVTRSLVTETVTDEQRVTDRAIIDANAADVSSILLAHRADAKALRKKAAQYREELDSSGDDLKVRITMLKMLSETQKTLVGIERQAIGIKDDAIMDDVTPGMAKRAIIIEGVSVRV